MLALVTQTLAFQAVHRLPGTRQGRSAVTMADRVFDAASAKGGTDIVNEKTALLFIEYQNEFTTENGKMHDAVKASMEKTGMLANAAAVCRVAREKGCTVIHAPITAAADGSVSSFSFAV